MDDYTENFGFGIDWMEVIRRLLKYIVLGLVVAFSATYLLHGRLEYESLLVLSLTVASTYALLDAFSPSIGGFARVGTGLGLGAAMVGF